ncbi:MAG: MFS transporter [Actinobacteria bacterium 13_2_20CM_2_71_6]|nr:MAG: MFS transporter [Actinobacteria bacterium 13_2_20CM_2_71_6]
MTEAPLKAGRREWIGLAVLMLPLLLISMDMTVLYYAVPAISAALSPSSSEQLWILDIYGFVLAGLLVTMGTLGDRIGRRRLLMIGAGAFGIASVASAYAHHAGTLIATRAVLGIAGATLMPSTMALVRNMFHDPKQRRTALAVWMAVFSGGTAVGPLVSGVLLDHFWWGSVFLINVPVMVLLVVLGPLLLPESRDPKPGRFDLLSALLSLAAVLPTIYGIKQLAVDGFGWVAVLAIVAGIGIGAVFVARQRRRANPTVDVRLFRHRAFGASVLINVLAAFALVGYALFTTQYMQLVLGLSPLAAALWSLPVTVAVAASATVVGMLAKAVRPAYLIGGGLVLSAAGLAVLTRIGAHSGLPILLVGAGIMASGVVAAMTLTADLILATAPAERAGAASALSETANELGGALGIALLGSIGAAVYRHQVVGALPAGLPHDARAAAHDTLGGATAVAAHLPGQAGAALLDGARVAFSHGLNITALAGAVTMAVAAILAVTLLRRVRTDPPAAEPAASEPELARQH